MRFTEKELAFIRDELKIEANREETREDVLDRIWDEACEVEIDESFVETLTERGKMAVALVTRFSKE